MTARVLTLQLQSMGTLLPNDPHARYSETKRPMVLIALSLMLSWATVGEAKNKIASQVVVVERRLFCFQ